MSAKSKARRRQDATGEKYQTSLMHIRGECSKCQRGKPCDGCLKYEPCWDCLPFCSMTRLDPNTPEVKTLLKCQFDDLLSPGTRKCSNCSNTWPPSSGKILEEVVKKLPTPCQHVFVLQGPNAEDAVCTKCGAVVTQDRDS